MSDTIKYKKPDVKDYVPSPMTDKQKIAEMAGYIVRLEREVEYLEKSSAKTERELENLRKKLYNILKETE